MAGIDLGGGHVGIVESLQPMAVPGASGHLVPIDLGLREVGGAYEPQTPAVGLTISKNLAAGVEIPSAGISLTPIGVESGAGRGEGDQVGASVFYANTATDSDTLVKPTTEGVEISTVLRSVESPQRLDFRVGLPEGAKLEQATAGTGAVTITANGAALAVIRPPRATDAGGTYVPVSMTVEGDSVILDVASHSKSYLWPIAVDPELAKTTDNSISEKSNWKWNASNEAKWGHNWESNQLDMYHQGGTSGAGEYTEGQYATQGESKIYKVEIESAGSVSKARAKLELAHEGVVEQKATIAENINYGATITTLCGNAECSTLGGHATNLASFKLEAAEPVTETYDPSGELWNTHVYVAQEKGPTPTFNETEERFSSGRLNALDGCHCTGGKEPWLGPYSDSAFEVKAHDPGIGISWAKVQIGSYKIEEPFWEDGLCKGVQCNENYATTITYSPGMPEGEQAIDWYAANLVGRLCEYCLGLTGHESQRVKIDATPPHNLEVSGWPANQEISATPHTLTLEATDGTSGTNSSGIKIDRCVGRRWARNARIGPDVQQWLLARAHNGERQLDTARGRPHRRRPPPRNHRNGQRQQRRIDGIHVRRAPLDAHPGRARDGRSDVGTVRPQRSGCLAGGHDRSRKGCRVP